VAAFEPRDCRQETSPPWRCSDATIRLRRLPLPHLTSSCWRSAGSCATASLPRRRRAAHRARGRGRPCHRLPLWVLRFTPLLADAAKPCRHTVGDRWQVDET
jgi:hypothetical protein